MDLRESLNIFFMVSVDDPRISPAHISLYAALLNLWAKKDYSSPMSVFSHEAMPLAKISGVATYYRIIRELNEFGFIRYIPSFNRFQGSEIYLLDIDRKSIRTGHIKLFHFKYK